MFLNSVVAVFFSGILYKQSLGYAVKKASPLICYRCDKVADAVDCTVTEACQDGEQCFTDKYISEEGNVYFSLGCKQKRICDILASLGKRQDVEAMTDRQKRNIIHLCTQCCDSGYCNNKLCTVLTTPVPARRCQYCTQLQEDPKSCVDIRVCKVGEECFADVVMDSYGDIRHRLGCRPKRMCDALFTHGVGVGHGKRQLHNEHHVGQLCGGCCDTDGCNREGCYSIRHYNLTHSG